MRWKRIYIERKIHASLMMFKSTYGFRSLSEAIEFILENSDLSVVDDELKKARIDGDPVAIKISPEVHRKLMTRKYELGFRTINGLLKCAIKNLKEKQAISVLSLG